MNEKENQIELQIWLIKFLRREKFPTDLISFLKKNIAATDVSWCITIWCDIYDAISREKILHFKITKLSNVLIIIITSIDWVF